MRIDKSTPMPASSPAIHTSEDPRHALIRQGRKLEYFTIAYNSLEGIVSIAAGLFAGSISLIGFGLDSFIEVTSAASLIWRFGRDRDEARRAAAERTSLRIVGPCFIGLSAYIAYDSGLALIRGEAPARSIPGILIALASLVAMPLLAKAKRKVASAIASSAMHADARQTDFCTYLSVILLGGTASERAVWVMVGRSGGGPVHGARHCEGRGRRSARPINVRILV